MDTFGPQRAPKYPYPLPPEALGESPQGGGVMEKSGPRLGARSDYGQVMAKLWAG